MSKWSCKTKRTEETNAIMNNYFSLKVRKRNFWEDFFLILHRKALTLFNVKIAFAETVFFPVCGRFEH